MSLRVDNRTPVLVIFKGGIGALAIARTLGRLGVPMYLIAQHGDSPVLHSRYWTKKYFWDFGAPQEDTLKFVMRVGAEIGGRPILLTLADWVALFIENNANVLRERFVFPNPPAPLIRRLANKWEMFRIAKEHNIPTPETLYPSTREEVVALSSAGRFPMIFKGADPARPNAAAKSIARSPEELLGHYDRIAAAGDPNAVVQEYIPGDAQSVWMCNAYFDEQSRCKAIFTGKKLRQVNDTGIASLAVCVPNETVAAQTKALMQGVGYRGAVGIGWRYDARDGQYKLLDVNARVSGVFRLFRPTNGMDVVRILYLDLTGQPIPATALDTGRKWMLEQDFDAAIAQLRSGQLSLRGWLQSLRGVRETHWFSPDDPAPFGVWFHERYNPSIMHWLTRSRALGTAAR